MKLNDYVDAEAGRQVALARRMGVSVPTVSNWCRGKRPIPVVRCCQIEAVTQWAVRRWELRPHDWHRIWPELVDAPGAPPHPPTSKGVSC